MQAVLAFPPQVIDHLKLRHGPGQLQCKGQTTLQLGDKFLHAPLMQHILEAGVLTVCSVTEVAMHSDNGLQCFDALFWRNKSHHISQPRKSLVVGMSDAHSATCHDVEANQFVVVIK